MQLPVLRRLQGPVHSWSSRGLSVEGQGRSALQTPPVLAFALGMTEVLIKVMIKEGEMGGFGGPN